MMIFVNEVYKAGKCPREFAEGLIKMLSCVCPHVGEEIWQKMGHDNTIAYEPWPTYDEAKTVEDTVEIAVQINGKTKGTLEIGKQDPKDDVIAKAKANNMPNDTIDRGIKKAAGDANSVNYEVLTYEGYGPGGVAIIVDTLTDNKNRTAANVRSAFTKGGGNVGTPGSVSYMFDKKGQIIIDKEECEMDADELMMLALDAGAEDFSEEEDSFEILTSPEDFSAVRETLEKEGVPMLEADVTMIPQTWTELTDEESIKKMNRILDLLDDDDDVQAVYHNWDE